MFTEEGLDKMVKLQKTVFERALSYLKDGGTITYSTCSVLGKENEQQAEYFADKYNLKICDTMQIMPSKGSMDGFFAVNMKQK